MKQQKCKNKQDSAITNKSDLQSTCNSSFALFKNCVKKISIPHEKKIKQKDYLSQGTIPVIDQGETFIGGYTNDANTILKCPFPVIVFGDHTKTIKLVNFDFAPGADGIKVLKPTEQYDIRFFFYAMQYVTGKMQDRGYSRNYQYLEKELIPTFSLPEQKRIVEKIDELFSDLDAAESELRVAKEKLEIYWHAILEKAFSKYRGPNRFLSDFIENPKYGTSQKCNYDISDATAVYRIPNIDHQTGNIDHSDIKFTILGEDEKEKLKLIPGDILMIRSNGSISLVGRCALVKTCDIKGVFAGYLIRLRIKDIKQLRPEYLLYFLSTHEARQYIESKAKSTSGVNNINAEEIKQILIPICDIGEQSKIIKEIEIHEPLHKKSSQLIDFSLCKLNILRQSILKQAFEGGLA